MVATVPSRGVAKHHPTAYLAIMDDLTGMPEGGAPSHETAEVRRRRLAWEAERIAEAEAELAAGQGISQADANAWLDSLDTGWPLPFPSRA